MRILHISVYRIDLPITGGGYYLSGVDLDGIEPGRLVAEYS